VTYEDGVCSRCHAIGNAAAEGGGSGKNDPAIRLVEFDAVKAVAYGAVVAAREAFCKMWVLM
jgi:hypothetical protein